MSYDDFCRLTPAEFNEAVKAWSDCRAAAERERWERMRMLAAITIQPHVKRKLTPKGLLRFPWDDKGEAHDIAAADADKDKAKERTAKLLERMRKG